MDMRRLLSISFVLALAIAGSHPVAQSTGYAAKRPVFGGACPACPWGAMPDIVEGRLHISRIARGRANEPINVAVLEHYGLSEEKMKAFGGTVAGGYTKGSDVAVIIGWGALTNAPEYALWYQATQENEFKYLELPADLRARLANAFYLQVHEAPLLLRGVDRRIPTIVRDGSAVYGRADMPDDFAS